jgi:cGMP-dependent protein kinase
MGGKITKQNKSNAQIVQSKQIKRSSNFKINNSLSPLKKQNSESPKIKVSTSVAILGTKSPFTLVPMQRQKKTKLVITARPLGEINVLQVINKNNYELNDQDLINECLLKHFFMRTLDKEARHEIIKEMTLCKVDKDEVLFKQGSLGSYFYIVRSGEFNLFINDKLANTMHRGDSFGELALLHGAPRSGTVIAGDESLVYCLERRNFRKIVDHINSLNFEENRKFINMIPILSNLESDFKSLLANQLMKQFYEPGSSIIKEGELASCLYIVKEGEVDCVHKGVLVRTLKKGEHFGEKSILLDCPRTLDVIAKTSVVVYSVSVETLTTMVGEKYKDVLLLSFIKITFTQSRMFSKINLRLVENAYDGFTMSHFRKGDLVIKFGYTLSSRIIVIIEGNIIDSNEKIVGKRGDILFEDYVSSLSKERTTLDLFAYPDLLIMETNTAEFIKILGGNFSFKELLRKSSGLEFLYKIPLLKTLPQKKIEMLSNVVNYTKYEDGKKIIKQGEVDDKFYIIKSGMVKIFIDDEYVRTLTTFGYFGERAIFFNEPRSATVISSGTVELYEITSNDFKHILEDSLASYLKNRFFLHDMGFQLKDFDYLGPLGHGNFGIVALVKNRKNDCEYALKFVCKKQIDHETLHTNLEQERAVLLKIDHPFIVKLVKSMKCDKYIYFLMEYIKGKELFEVIRDIGLLNKSQTMFYGASLMITIDYLHEKKCVYRDLKPENVMIGENVIKINLRDSLNLSILGQLKK